MPVDIDLLQQPQKMAEEYIKGKKGEACNATKKHGRDENETHHLWNLH